jgi:periplasmic protein CpxP/Spy
MTDDTHTPETPAAQPAPAKPRSKKKFLAFVAAGALAIAAAAGGIAAYAKGPSGWSEGFMLQRIDRILDRVDATQEQKDKIKAIFAEAREDMAAMHGERDAIRKELTDLLTAPTFDRNALEAKRAERMAKMDAFSKDMTKALADAAEVLNAEQRKELVGLLQQRMERRGDRRDHMRGHQRGDLAPGAPGLEGAPQGG